MAVKTKKSKKPIIDTLDVKSPDIQVDAFNAEDTAEFLSLSQDALLVINDLGEILKTNSVFLDLCGYDAETLQKKHILDIFDERDRPYIRNLILAYDPQEMGQERPLLNFEARVLTKGNDVKWVEWRKQLCGDLLYCTGRDITHMKQQQKK